ncbi:MAG: PAS domain-containing sensor histidine kinase [Bacteroidales bacterium]|nr:PAS domain-containing sensor histidine kinase [Bacteroidales bacterium]
MEDAHDPGSDEELKKTLNLLEVILGSIPNGILLTHSNGTVLKANAKLAELWKIPESVLRSYDLNSLILFLREQVVDFVEFDARLNNYKMSESETWDLIHFKDGRVFESSSKPFCLDNLTTGRVWSFTDITKASHLDNELWTRKKLLSAILENIPDQVYYKDRNSRFILCNMPVALNCGANTTEEMIGKSDFDFFPLNLAEQYYQDEQLIMESGQPLINHEELSRNKKNEAARWNHTTKMPVRDAAGQVIGLVGINRDITERKKAEQDLKLTNDELIKSNSEKDKFFSIIAHDLRSPFNSLLGLTKVLAEELPFLTIAQMQKLAGNLNDSAEKLFNLLENLLEWSMLQRDVFPFNPKPFLIFDTVEQILELMHEASEKKTIGITVDIPKDLKATADQRMFESLIRNLVYNSIKFTPRGGKINISAKPLSGKSVEISVRDTGIGMNDYMVSNLFHLDNVPCRKGTEGEPSTGLGLIICKDFIDKHGGKIQAESQEGKGTTIRFTL